MENSDWFRYVPAPVLDGETGVNWSAEFGEASGCERHPLARYL